MLLKEPQPSTHASLFLFVIFLFCSFASSYQQACNHQDQSSLLAFSANASTPSPRLNWSNTISCCQWEGVHCNANGRVTYLALSSRGLKGVITSSIGNLVSLVYLNLSNNDILGSLAEEIFGLPNLRIIDLSFNSIIGPIPEGIGNLLHLQKLYLQNNNLNGPIPPSLMICARLLDLVLRNNHLHGDISKLDFSRLAQLQKLDLQNNSFSGTLPESIYSCKSLIAIRVFGNNLTGQISPKIADLKSLSFLSLSNNSFTKITTTLKVLAKCKNLTIAFLGWNFYGETLPSDRNFLGSTAFPKLQYFSLDGCNLTGLFPEWLSHVQTVRLLKFDNNKITGRIPRFLGTLPNLFSLSLAGNLLFGEIPQELCRLPALVSEVVDPKLNHFDFELPLFYYVAGKYVECTTVPTTLILAYNRLSGHIPLEIGELKSLQQLGLQHNKFSGLIPVNISNLKSLESLDLSENNLTGGIPMSLGNLHFLSDLNVSYNDLRGPIPTCGQFDTFGESSFEGNPGLCSELLHRPCSNTATPKANDQPLKDESGGKQSFLNGLYVGIASGFSGVLVVVASYVWFNICI